MKGKYTYMRDAEGIGSIEGLDRRERKSSLDNTHAVDRVADPAGQ